MLHIADREHSGLNSLGEFGYSGVERVGDVEILLTTLDCLRKRGEIPRVDVLKMDVEGAEMRVLSGAAETLATISLSCSWSCLILPCADKARAGKRFSISFVQQAFGCLSSIPFREDLFSGWIETRTQLQHRGLSPRRPIRPVMPIGPLPLATPPCRAH